MKFLKAFLAFIVVSAALLAGSVSAKSPSPGGPIKGGPIGGIGGGGVVSPQGYFDPSFQYLESGYNAIQANGNKTITVYAVTYATQYVQLIGNTVYFDRWDGNSWTHLNTLYQSDSNEIITAGGGAFYCTPGYYYRGRTVHWVYHNGVYEEGQRVTPSMLCQ